MAKDPALLWYFNDWSGGTTIMSRHLKGCYMDLLSAQFNSGPMSLEEIKTVLGSDFGSSWPTIQKKFKCENGLYFNERLQSERDKRVNYSESRRKNRTYVNHMENRNEDENIIKNNYGEFGKVLLTSEEHQKLITRFGELNTAILITELDGYIKQNGQKGEKKYVDHYATIGNWARRKFTKHQQEVVKSKSSVAF